MSNWESERKKRLEGEETKSEWVSCHGIHMQPATSFEKTFVWKPKKKSKKKKVRRKSKKEKERELTSCQDRKENANLKTFAIW